MIGPTMAHDSRHRATGLAIYWLRLTRARVCPVLWVLCMRHRTGETPMLDLLAGIRVVSFNHPDERRRSLVETTKALCC